MRSSPVPPPPPVRGCFPPRQGGESGGSGGDGAFVAWDAANHAPAMTPAGVGGGGSAPMSHLGHIVEHTALQAALFEQLTK